MVVNITSLRCEECCVCDDITNPGCSLLNTDTCCSLVWTTDCRVCSSSSPVWFQQRWVHSVPVWAEGTITATNYWDIRVLYEQRLGRISLCVSIVSTCLQLMCLINKCSVEWRILALLCETEPAVRDVPRRLSLRHHGHAAIVVSKPQQSGGRERRGRALTCIIKATVPVSMQQVSPICFTHTLMS